jgi:hypothetical protein
MTEVIIIIIVASIALYFFYSFFDKVKVKDQESIEKRQTKSPFKWIAIISGILLFALLSLHIISYKGDFFILTKNQLTYSNTFVNDDDIEALIERYNNASQGERVAMNSEPLMRKLKEKGIIIEDNIFNTKRKK